MSQILLILARAVHVAAGAIWVGGAVFAAAFLLPSIIAAGPAGGAVMDQVARVRGLPKHMMGLMALTILSGIGLMWYVSGGFDGHWFGTRMGHGISIGAALAIAGSLLGVIVNKPTAMKMQQLVEAMKQSGGAPTPEQSAQMAMLQAKMLRSSNITAVLLVLATIAMGISRYL